MITLFFNLPLLVYIWIVNSVNWFKSPSSFGSQVAFHFFSLSLLFFWHRNFLRKEIDRFPVSFIATVHKETRKSQWFSSSFSPSISSSSGSNITKSRKISRLDHQALLSLGRFHSLRLPIYWEYVSLGFSISVFINLLHINSYENLYFVVGNLIYF